MSMRKKISNKKWGRESSPASRARELQEEAELKLLLENEKKKVADLNVQQTTSDITIAAEISAAEISAAEITAAEITAAEITAAEISAAESNTSECSASESSASASICRELGLTAEQKAKIDSIIERVLEKQRDLDDCSDNTSVQSFTSNVSSSLPEVNTPRPDVIEPRPSLKYQDLNATESVEMFSFAKMETTFTAKKSIRQSCEEILRKQGKTGQEYNSAEVSEEPVIIYKTLLTKMENQVEKDKITKEEIEEYQLKLENEDCHTAVVGESGAIHQFTKDGLTLMEIKKGKSKAKKECTKEKSPPCSSDDEDGYDMKSSEIYEENLMLPCTVSSDSVCVIVGHKYVPMKELVKLQIPKVFTEKKLTREMKNLLASEPSQVKLNNNNEKPNTTIASAIPTEECNVISEIEVKLENDNYIKNPIIIRYLQQQNRFMDKLNNGILTELDILRGVSQLIPDHRKWSNDESNLNDTPLIDVRFLYFMVHFYTERLKKDDGYHLQAYLLEGYYPICMLLEFGVPEHTSEQKPISPEILAQLDVKLKEYWTEKTKHENDEDGGASLEHLYNEVNAFYMINGYYRALLHRSKMMKNPMKRSFAVTAFELYMIHKPEGQISYQNFVNWICKNEVLVVAVDSEERTQKRKASIQTYQTDEIIRFLNRSAYDYFHNQKKLPPPDPLAVRLNIEYKKISARELGGNCKMRRKESCPVTGCNYMIQSNKHLAHFLNKHTISLAELWLGQRGVFFFNPTLYPDCSNVFCLAVIALNLGNRESKYQNISLPQGCDDLKNHYPISIMYCKLDEKDLTCSGVQYYFWVMTNSLPEYLKLRIVMSIYPMNMSRVKTLSLPIIEQSDFKHVHHLISNKPDAIFNIKYKQLKYLTQGFEQFVCLDIKILKVIRPKKSSKSDDTDDE